MTQTYSRACQCGKVRYDVQMDIGEVLACNCSRCRRLGALLAFAPATHFKLLSGEADLTKFEFNKHMIQHQFCSTWAFSHTQSERTRRLVRKWRPSTCDA